MGETAFTPGPWQWVNDEEIEQAEHPFTSVAETFPIHRDTDSVQQNANCRLIAAAPELYAALQLAREMFVANDLYLERTFEKIDEALAKARGGTPNGD